MGARLYNPTTGHFTSLDPVHGGNDTPYGYPNDPTNKQDTTGKEYKYTRWAKAKGSAVMAAAKRAGAKCYWNSTYGMNVCYGGGWSPYSVKGGTTWGNTFYARSMSRAQTNRKGLMAHEAVHYHQWRKYGPGFSIRYALASLASKVKTKGKSSACKNKFEIEAGLTAGGYLCS